MGKDRDLLPWIFGGLSIATVAIAVILGSTYGNAPPKPSDAPSAMIAHPMPAAETPVAPPAAPVPAPALAQIVAGAQIETAAPPVKTNSRIWECTINGQKTFSDNPCGDRPSLREIGTINGMDPTPILPQTRPFAPEPSYRPEYSYSGEQVDSYAGEPQFISSPYPVFIAIPFHERRRPDHGHQPHGHDHAPQMGKRI